METRLTRKQRRPAGIFVLLLSLVMGGVFVLLAMDIGDWRFVYAAAVPVLLGLITSLAMLIAA